MERETRIQIAKAVGVIGTIGLGISGILVAPAGAVGVAAMGTLSNVGINLLSGLIETTGSKGLERVGRSPLVNHDVEQAMLKAIQLSLEKIGQMYQAEAIKDLSWWDKQWYKDPNAIQVFLDELYQDLKTRFFEAADAVFTLPKVQAYLHDVQQQPHPDLLNQLAVSIPFLKERCGERFAQLFEAQLLPQIQHFFTEQLKTNERVRTGFEQFLFQKILKLAQETKTIVAHTAEDVKELLSRMAKGLHLPNSKEFEQFETQLTQLDAQYAECEAEIEELNTAGLGQSKQVTKKEAERLQIDTERTRLQREKEAFVGLVQQLRQNRPNLARRCLCPTSANACVGRENEGS